jgi:hypothetical protein|nr:MAG TPA_asm: Pyridoxine 5'-phosphate oxidase C-terminal dimerization region [Caudoviricetes sp.]
MRYFVEQDANRFEFWSGAAHRMADATDAQREAVYERLEEFADGSVELSETDINDYVWFECDDIFDESEE